MKKNNFLRVMILTGIVSISATAIAESDDMKVMNMEQHWQQLINEKDQKRRQEMLMEHRHMMGEMDKEVAGRGMGMGKGHHHNMMNTVDMHRSMMDMME